MARTSSSGLPYLIRRSESGNFTYIRSIPEALSSYVAGAISGDWMRRDQPIAGIKTIKITLGSGDETLARGRWGVVHGQVEELIKGASARAALAQSKRPVGLESRTTLSPNELSVIGQQVRHDVLRQHDDSWIAPENLDPMAEIILKVANSSGDGSKMEVDTARKIARGVEARLAQAALRNPTSSGVDRPLIITEVPRHAEAVSATTLKATTVASELTQVLAQNGVWLEEGPSRKAAELTVLRSKVAALDEVAKREAGNIIHTPDRPAPIAPPPSDVIDEAPTLSKALEGWQRAREPKDKELGDRTLYVERFISMFGDLKVSQITKKHIRDFRNLHLEMPSHVPQKLKSCPPEAQVAWANENPSVKRLGRHTINAKVVGGISTMISWAIKEGFCEFNPCDRMRLDVDPAKGHSVEKLPFADRHLNAIFSHPYYIGSKRFPAGAGGEAGYWLPLLALYTGARLEELGQLNVADIKRCDEIDYFDITILSDVEDVDLDPDEHQKSLKNPGSRRQVPVHAMLKSFGFLDYVDELRARKVARLFPLLLPYRERMTKNFSRWWGRFQDAHVSSSVGYTFHSFRHSFVFALRNKRVSEAQIAGLVGHSTGHMTGKYGLPIILGERVGLLAELQYPAVDFSLLRRPGN